MSKEYNLDRFVKAQDKSYSTALAEIKNGRKRSHWMWYIFPQVQGLGYSETSRYYAIQNGSEAAAYLQHPVLGQRLVDICEALLQLPSPNASHIFGSPDDIKLKSSMTLFASVPGAHPVFQQVLTMYFGGEKDKTTLQIIKNHA